MVLRFLMVLLLTGVGFQGVRDNQPPDKLPVEDPAAKAPIAQEEAKDIKVVRVQYATSSVLCELLNKTFKGGEGPARIMVNDDRRTNALLLTGAPKDLAQAMDVIRDLDLPMEADLEGWSSETWVQVAVYELVLPSGAAATLDVTKLNESAQTAEAFQAALGGLGTARVCYRIEQTVDLESPCKLEIGAKTPFVTGSSTSAGGQVSRAVTYDNAGVKAGLSGQWDRQVADRGHVSLELELQNMLNSEIDLGNGAKAPSWQTVKQHYDGTVISNKPVALLSLMGTNGQAVAYISRLVFRRVSVKAP